jgi:mannose-6-phosphate isomerase-like protein (cupin superfamily)
MQPRQVSRATAEHYTWGDQCDGWHLVKDERLSVIAERMPPGTAEVRHYHACSQQFFWILAGEAVMEVDGSEIRLAAGEGLRVHPGTPHQIRNHAQEPVQFLVISEPPSHGDRVVVEE